MEWWSNGVLKIKKRMMVYSYVPPPIIHLKKDLILPNPILQHSFTPACHAEVAPLHDEGGPVPPKSHLGATKADTP
jgi:hypothetical protein